MLSDSLGSEGSLPKLVLLIAPEDCLGCRIPVKEIRELIRSGVADPTVHVFVREGHLEVVRAHFTRERVHVRMHTFSRRDVERIPEDLTFPTLAVVRGGGVVAHWDLSEDDASSVADSVASWLTS
ncbi:MAG: hypothetical protein OEZ65_09655 [Gemmatimonadota bacterium]|nr:hypothetical protein [Gemmatimonadota bacterium]